MKVSGFTLVKNGVKFCYPFKEAILSILPLCDEFIVNVGDSEDGTLESVESIDNEKIKIIRRQWDMSLREHGQLLSVETNHALNQCTGDWRFYIQADEVLHEKYFSVVTEAMTKYLGNAKIEGLRFKYKHFYGSYDYYQDNYRRWYVRQARVVRKKGDVVSWGDAMDFKHPDGSKLNVVDIDAEIYHYGHVRPPSAMTEKTEGFNKLYHSDQEVSQIMHSFQLYDDLGNLKKFEETHPAVMLDRIKCSNWEFDAKLNEQYPDWLRAILIFLHPLTKRVKRFFGAQNA